MDAGLSISVRLAEHLDALEGALGAARGTREVERLGHYLTARAKLRDVLSDADYRDLSFQFWQEGAARYTEYRVAEAAAELHDRCPRSGRSMTSFRTPLPPTRSAAHSPRTWRRPTSLRGSASHFTP